MTFESVKSRELMIQLEFAFVCHLKLNNSCLGIAQSETATGKAIVIILFHIRTQTL